MEAAKSLRGRDDVMFLIIGRGTELEKLKRVASSALLENVVFKDEVSPSEIDYYCLKCAAGIVSLNQNHRSHNVPGKMITYLRAGLPIFCLCKQRQ